MYERSQGNFSFFARTCELMVHVRPRRAADEVGRGCTDGVPLVVAAALSIMGAKGGATAAANVAAFQSLNTAARAEALRLANAKRDKGDADYTDAKACALMPSNTIARKWVTLLS